MRRLGPLFCVAGLLLAAPTLSRAESASDTLSPEAIRAMTATEMMAAQAEGQLTAPRILMAIAAAAPLNEHLNAVVAISPAADAEAEAVEVRRQSGAVPRPLEGVPILIKDSIHVAGLPNTAGTPALASFVPRVDAPVVARLRAAGAVILGKAAMNELGFGISGYNPAEPGLQSVGTRNPYDVSRFSGGSSSGSAAAVAARMVPVALGTDTGGSVRIPAAVTGILGFRPSIGRYPQEGITPISFTRDACGPLARSMADIIRLDQVLSGDARPIAPGELRALRIGMPKQPFWQDLDADTGLAMVQVEQVLTRAGVTLVPLDMTDVQRLAMDIGRTIALHEARITMQAYLQAHDVGVSLEDLIAAVQTPEVAASWAELILPGLMLTAEGGTVPSEPAYREAIGVIRPKLRLAYQQAFATHDLDAILFPTVPEVAIPQGPEANAYEVFTRFTRNTEPGSDAGLPGLSMPVALGERTGLPVGMELDALPGQDRALLAIGLALETLFPPLPPPALLP